MTVVMGSIFSNKGHKRVTKLATTIIAAGTVLSTDAQDVLPLPTGAFDQEEQLGNPVIDLADRMISASGSLEPEIPEKMTIESNGAEILFENENRVLTYKAKDKDIKLLTDGGLDVEAKEIRVELEKKKAYLVGPLTIYQGESLTKAAAGVYDWAADTMEVTDSHSKVMGILIKSARLHYEKDKNGKNQLRLNDAFVSTDDSQSPDTWVGAKELIVYPGDSGVVSGLSVGSGEYSTPVPVLGWLTFSHSLNPREGYMPNFGAKSSQGTYLRNRYGFLLGNRRVENNMPVADYILSTHLDYRTRRGFATGIDLEDMKMSDKYPLMTGLEAYYLHDSDPSINPTNTPREEIDRERYRVALNALWELPSPGNDTGATWSTAAHINILSDRYILRDFFEDLSRANDKPDNTLRLVRRDEQSQTMLMTRLAPNDFYQTDQRLELSYYRVRSALAHTGISYETRNSFGVIKQEIPVAERIRYQNAIDRIADQQMREYYQRMLNTRPYFRANSTHEFARHFSVLKFLNITPKAGVGYSGYYGVDGVGADNRFLGFLGVDANMKISRHYDSFALPLLGYKGLTHSIKPYTTLSHCSISSSNRLVPQIDSWSADFGTTSGNPMALDLMGFSAIDSWGAWDIWRFGVENHLTTQIDGITHNLLSWNVFVDYNQKTPLDEADFSNLYSFLSVQPTENFSMWLNTETPTFKDKEGYSKYSAGISFQPVASFCTSLSYRSVKDHPTQGTAEQITSRNTLRINEKYTFDIELGFDLEHHEVPVQQYSLFSKSGSWYTGATLYFRRNGGKQEVGFGLSLTLSETGTALPITLY